MKNLLFWKMVSASISEVAIAFYLILILSFYGNLGAMSITESILAGTIFMVAIPISSIVIFYKKIILALGLIERKERPKFYIVNLISYSAVLLLFNYSNNIPMMELALSYLFVIFVMFLINFKWKISLHGAGIGILITALFLTFGNVSLILLPLIPFTFWLRLKLKAHNIYQLIAGTAVASIITAIVYSVL